MGTIARGPCSSVGSHSERRLPLRWQRPAVTLTLHPCCPTAPHCDPQASGENKICHRRLPLLEVLGRNRSSDGEKTEKIPRQEFGIQIKTTTTTAAAKKSKQKKEKKAPNKGAVDGVLRLWRVCERKVQTALTGHPRGLGGQGHAAGTTRVGTVSRSSSAKGPSQWEEPGEPALPSPLRAERHSQSSPSPHSATTHETPAT